MENSVQHALEKKEKLPISLIWLTIGAFAIGMTEFIVMGLLPNVAHDLHVSIPTAGQIITSYALGVAVGAPLLTIATHSLPKKKLLILFMVIFTLGNAFSMIAPNYGMLIIARLITALAHGTFLGVGSLIAMKLVSPERKGSAVSLVLAGLTIANIIGVPFGTFIGQIFGWRASFGVITFLGVISLLGIYGYIPVIQEDKASNVMKEIKGVVNPKVLFNLFVGLLGCASLFSLFTYITPILQSVSGFKEGHITWILIIFGVGVTIGNIIGGRLSDWKLLPYIMVNFLLLAIILAGMALILKTSLLVIPFVFIWGVAAFAMLPGIQLRTMLLAGDSPTLAAVSNHSALNIGNALGASMGGVVIVHFGLAALPFFASSLAFLAFIGIVYLLITERKKRVL
ncbi:MFS transporter [Heyndrickxia acidicola]|uniref:MFS transporter n=1 Tax=Heyndrickxia acidicola TaxID=209389 RepID=A0ABU6MFR9_9BACI|nr:MFS transporter [Heyndrickxia acidicola]MED1203516.1 MFS transporter [Heyndrickxia acidicola]